MGLSLRIRRDIGLFTVLPYLVVLAESQDPDTHCEITAFDHGRLLGAEC